ncbi:hypothetical protein [Paenirhodobacter sp.]|uniref:hypothetical protein n=1 Tax=Paenirhodobacter sp. TaxID=1965326 RepID=UPI003B409F2D
MAYNLEDFSVMRKRLQEALKDEAGVPLSCQLFDCCNPAGYVQIVDGAGNVVEYHVAEACNIAGMINSLGRILALPRSNVSCRELSEMFLVSLDVLREYIRAAFPTRFYNEVEDDKVIRRWAGFIKHPSDFVFAHRCLSEKYSDCEPTPIVITSSYLKEWDNLRREDRDAKKRELANRIVTVELPSVGEVLRFFDSCANHLKRLIERSK